MGPQIDRGQSCSCKTDWPDDATICGRAYVHTPDPLRFTSMDVGFSAQPSAACVRDTARKDSITSPPVNLRNLVDELHSISISRHCLVLPRLLRLRFIIWRSLSALSALRMPPW